ncbi:metabolite traffic protein EboE [Cyclobacterium roseum]|uniref:metabolite traffic protein EboE n=1 Tax=Cyclobacterium roseum TaxID=2666137 RepID=UPI001391F7CE|nr:metabolite traffic protein EboE [Cyclobacterium roseum]
MRIADYHLTYCTNIHPGESWEATFTNLKDYVPPIKERLSAKQLFGIGLRISDEASRELMEPGKLGELKSWLEANHCYVFTLNGFPFGGFHRQVVKDEVHHPDWTTRDRVTYTLRLFDILSAIMPSGMDAGISTSPLSYKHWHKTPEALEQVMIQSCDHLLEVVDRLYLLKKEKGQLLHLDIEPEPDGIIENSAGLIQFYKNWLLPRGMRLFGEKYGMAAAAARELILDHIRVCYDVCHFAVAYEDHDAVLKTFKEEGIKIGKFQLSAALKISIPEKMGERKTVEKALLPFVESTYLHQVIGVERDGTQHAYPDLPDALLKLSETEEVEWRIHFHVPVFLSGYGTLQSTQEDILTVLKLNEKGQYSAQLEVETYTWEVLPEDIHLSLGQSITRELDWVKKQIT